MLGDFRFEAHHGISGINRTTCQLLVRLLLTDSASNSLAAQVSITASSLICIPRHGKNRRLVSEDGILVAPDGSLADCKIFVRMPVTLLAQPDCAKDELSWIPNSR